jgi:hypothetical protein
VEVHRSAKTTGALGDDCPRPEAGRDGLTHTIEPKV